VVASHFFARIPASRALCVASYRLFRPSTGEADYLSAVTGRRSACAGPLSRGLTLAKLAAQTGSE
jgi:hypothetical protein